MREMRIKPSALNRWIHQNKAVPTGDFVEGVLLDSFVLTCKRGCAAVFEHPINAWQSDYRVLFEPGDAPGVWAAWSRFEAASAAA